MKTSIHQDSPLILIADDDRSTRILLRAILQKEGYRVLEVSNGKECIEAYKQHKPDMVLLDAIMPIIDGFTCCQQLLNMDAANWETGKDHKSGTPILIITGLDNRKSVDRAFKVGATDYITKPLHPFVLRQRLRRILETKRAQEALKESENKYRSLVNNLKEVIFQLNTKGELTFLNPAWSEITKFPVYKSLGNPLSQFIHPQDYWLYQQQFKSLFYRQKKNVYFPTRYLKQSGELGWIEIYAYPVLLSNNSLVGIAGTINDITGRKHQEIYQKIENSITKILTESVTVSEVAAKIIRVFCFNLDWDVGDFWYIDLETQLLFCQISENQSLHKLSDSVNVESPHNCYSINNFLHRVLSEKRPILYQDLSSDQNLLESNSPNIISFKTGFGFPIINGEEKLGVITLFSHKIKQVEPDLLRIVATISHQIGQFIKRKQAEEKLKRQHIILQSELSQASKYVRSLLPSPLTDKIKIEQQFLPSIQLGGDIFDYYWLDEHNLVIYLLDVAGHGVRSALLSVSIRNILRSQSLYNTNFYEPWTVLAELNRVFQMDEKGNDYFTIWYGVYNLENRELVYSCAAHPPAILLVPDSSTITVTQLSTENIAIGMLPEFDFEQEYIQIEPGSTLYIFSDGVYEITQTNGNIWGFDAFVNTLKRYHQSCNSNLEQVLHYVQQVNGNQTLDDDFSLIQLIFQ